MSYDALGRVRSSTTSIGGVRRNISYEYDAAGNRTRITHPDGVWFGTGYNLLGEATSATWTAAGGTVPFMAVSLDNLGRRRDINRASSYTGYDYDPASRLTGQNQRYANGYGNTTVSLDYNPASQITARNESSPEYSFPGLPADRTYQVNGLNQYASVTTAAGTLTYGYDGRGNLVSDGMNSYGYDLQNRLTSASTGSGSAALSYDPLGRLWQVSSPQTGKTQFLYDGDQVVAEYDGDSGAMRRRFFWGPGTDEPILQDEGGAMNCSGTRFLHTDERGSVIGIADCSGNRIQTNRYDPAGIPVTSANWGRFGFTGQAWLGEIGLYYYKARMYSPMLGRFMQTDPTGYADGMNMYAYAGNDPVNMTDPSGMDRCPAGSPPDMICATAPTTRQNASPTGGGSGVSFDPIRLVKGIVCLFGGCGRKAGAKADVAASPQNDRFAAKPVDYCGAAGSEGVPEGMAATSFQGPCRKHDDCYGTLGKIQEQCDQGLGRDILNECKRTGGWLCALSSYVYYRALAGIPGVISPGKAAFDNAQRATRLRLMPGGRP